MPSSLTLPAAAGAAFDNLQVKWLTGSQLGPAVRFFCGNIKLLFSEQNPNEHPVINWNTILWSLGTQIAGGTLAQLTLSAEYVYRMCWMTSQLQTQGLITAAQGAAVLSNYNLFFAAP